MIGSVLGNEVSALSSPIAESQGNHSSNSDPNPGNSDCVSLATPTH